MKLRKTQVAAAVGGALLLVGTAVQAQAPMTVQLYGHVNRALMHADNGTQSKWFHVDGQPSSTRFGIKGSSQASAGLRLGAQFEVEMKSNPADSVTFDDPDQAASLGERWLEATVEGGFGKISIGQGSAAAHGTLTRDLSGTDNALSHPLNDFGGSIPFSSGGVNTAVTPNAVINQLNHESRYDRLMYTTPVFGGFWVQASVGQKTDAGEAKEIGLWYRGKLAGDIQAAIGWSNVNLSTPTQPNDRETIGGSVAWLHSSGFNIMGAYGQRDLPVSPSRDTTFWEIKPGYKFGQHNLAISYQKNDDLAANGDEGTGMGLGWVWNAARWADIYASYMLFSLDRPGTSFDDITVVAIGTQVRF